MIIIGNRKNLSIGGWILAALLILTYSGVTLVSLLDPALTGYSAKVRMVSRKWHELGGIKAKTTTVKLKGLDLSSAMYKKPPPPPKIEPNIEKTAIEDPEPPPAPIEVIPPRLSGIFERRDVNGEAVFYALIEGRKLAEKDTVSGFVIGKIDQNGVTLVREGRQWFLRRPDVFFSLDKDGQINRGKVSTNNAPSEPAKVHEDEAQAIEALQNAEKLREL